MALYSFTERPRALVSQQMLNLRARIGGTIGQIKVGMESLDAIKVRDNVYVTAKTPSRAMRAFVNLARADIHSVDHPADIQLLKDRLEVLDGR